MPVRIVLGLENLEVRKMLYLHLGGNYIHPKASEWILNADIAKCFDRINHDFLLRSVPVYRKVDRNVLKKMLKAKVIDMRDVIYPRNGYSARWCVITYLV